MSAVILPSHQVALVAQAPSSSPPAALVAGRPGAPAATACTGSPQDSDPVQSTPVRLFSQEAKASFPYPAGKPGRSVVRTQADWKRVWYQLVANQPLPHVNLRDSAVVIVASQVVGSGPYSVEIESIRRCKTGDEGVILVRTHRHYHQFDTPDRSVRAVSIPGSLAARYRFRFIDLPIVVDP